jgi:hypothetical protein
VTTVVRWSLWNVYKIQAKDACHGPLFPSSRLFDAYKRIQKDPKVLTQSETPQLNKSPLALVKLLMSKTKVQIIHLGASKNDTRALCWYWVCLAYLSSTKFLLWYALGKCPLRCISSVVNLHKFAPWTKPLHLVCFLRGKVSRFQRYQIELKLNWNWILLKFVLST